MKDTNARSLVKGISWRMVGTIDTFVIAYLYFGELSIAAPIAATEVLTKIILYYFHERIWNIIYWGRHTHKPTKLRSLIKGISWRFFGSLDTILISFMYSGNPLSSMKVGGTEVLTKIGLFYLHERLWAQIKWGRIFILLAKEIEL
jgi:uncharacterized membrane protein